ncbi:hypothetical protein CKAH01_14230 [Colletotrichum kahawae]|uniref:Uncharacterized protein n=1 Tax=Colletotrichum kahawae TaxID=34407 RepID=A0AAD9YLP8_COLKA|nr:hypothetical protein CKAH01_14230 [Colletotrichum kahawae]
MDFVQLPYLFTCQRDTCSRRAHTSRQESSSLFSNLAAIAGPTFHPAWLPRVRPAAQVITIAGHALLMTAWIDAQNRICIILDAAFPGLHGTIIPGVQNLHNNLAVLPHVFELGKTYVASDNQAEIQPGDTWRWF